MKTSTSTAPGAAATYATSFDFAPGGFGRHNESDGVVVQGDGKVVTLSGLGTAEKPHPLQTAYVEEQVTQCGYCINGWIMTAAA